MTANGSQDLDKTAQLIAERLAKVISLHPIADYDTSDYIVKYLERRKNRLFLNEIIPVSLSPLTAVGEVPHGFLLEESPTALLWFWNNSLSPIYTLTLWWKIHGRSKLFSLRLFLPSESEEFQSFLSQETYILLVRNKKYFTSLLLDVRDLDEHFWGLLDDRVPQENVGDVDAAKIWVNSSIEKPNTPIQTLQSGWANRLEYEIKVAVRFFRDPALAEHRAKELPVVNQSLFADYFSGQEGMLSYLYLSMQESYSNPDLDLIKTITLPNLALADAPNHRDFVKLIMECAWFSSSRTKCGLRLMSLELDGKLHTLDIDTDVLAEKVHYFWERLPLIFPFYYSQLFGSGSCPMDPFQFLNSFPLYQGDIDEGWTFVHSLLAEATSLKKWTIPFGAYVQLDIGEIKAVKVFEVGSEVACVLVNQEGEYFLVWVDPIEEKFVFIHEIKIANFAGLVASEKADFLQLKDEKYDPDAIDRYKLSIAIPLAAIIRDFWVVEERIKVFGESKTTRRSARLTSDTKEQSIVYLPRVRYVGDIKRLAEPLHLEKRRPHFVTGHLRRAAEASEKQIWLARKYGIIVPVGFTFVRPHRRGDKAQETIYRSRSALQCIRALRPISAIDQKDDWFIFELNVADWLKRNGFEVEHLAGSRNGDGGVDIQACKGDEVLLIQCKYWHKTKIGPAVIRELMGTLQTFPKGTKGVLITSTEITRKAQKLAVENGIEFMQNVDFRSKIHFELN